MLLLNEKQLAWLFTPEQAEREAVRLRSDEDLRDWQFIVRHCPNKTGKSIIEVYDEDCNYLGSI